MTAETAAASNVRVYVAALERLGYDTEVLIKAAGLQRADVNDPDGCIPCSCINALFQQAMKERPLSNLGMRIAAETPIGAYPLIDYLVVTCETVGEGLKQLSHYFRLVRFPVLLNIRDEEEPVRVVYEGPPSPFGFEFGVSLCRSEERRVGKECRSRWSP